MSSPDVPAALHRLQAGDPGGALRLLDRVLAAEGDDLDARFYRAKAREMLGDPKGALEDYQAVLARSPDDVSCLAGAAVCLGVLGRYSEALEACDGVLRQMPGQPDITFNRAGCLARMDRHDEALAAYDAYLLNRPTDLQALVQRAVVLYEADRLNEALTALEHADPAGRSVESLANRALVLQALGRPRDAWGVFDQAIELAAASGRTERMDSLRYHRGLAALHTHDLARAWPDYEYRWAAGLVDPPALDRGESAWRGERVPVLRVWREQPVGDEVLLSRLLPAAAARVDRLVLECSPRMVPLFARSLPEIEVRAQGEVDAPADAQVSIAGLGAAMGCGIEALSGGDAWLKADPARVAVLRSRYEAAARGRPIIGLSWRSENQTLGGQKSAPLEDWSALLLRPALFVNLQYGPAANDAVDVASRLGCEILTDPDIDQLADLDAFAAQVQAMDQVVSVSNTTVHFAGALGVPCIVMVPPNRGRLWYWGADGETTPWYASVRVHRRSRDEGWADQIAAVARATGLQPLSP